MNMEITLETGGHRPAGLDFSILEDDLTAEIDKFSASFGTKSSELERSLPLGGAQGDPESIRWLLDLAENPHLIELGIRTLIFSLNELVQAVKGSPSPASESEESEGEEQGDSKKAAGIVVRLKLFGKQLELPASLALIKEFLLSLESGA